MSLEDIKNDNFFGKRENAKVGRNRPEIITEG